MDHNIQEVLKKGTVCEKHTSTTTFKITPDVVSDPELFKVWGLYVVGPFPTAKQVKDFPL